MNASFDKTENAARQTLQNAYGDAEPLYKAQLSALNKLSRSPDAKAADCAAQFANTATLGERLQARLLYDWPASLKPENGIPQIADALGRTQFTRLAIEALLYEITVNDIPGGFHQGLKHWRHALATAVAAQTLAERTGLADPREAWMSGLLHDIGKTPLYIGLGADAVMIEQIAQATPWEVDEAERLLGGVSHGALSAFMADQWGFPAHVVDAIADRHELDDKEEDAGPDEPTLRLTAVLQLSDYLAWILGMGSVPERRHPTLSEAVTRLMQPERLATSGLLQRIHGEMTRLAGFYPIDLPGPGYWRENLLKANIQLGRVNAQLKHAAQHKGHTPSADTFANPAPRASLLAPHRSLDFREIFRSTAKAVRKDFQFGRVLLYRIASDRKTLKLFAQDGPQEHANEQQLASIPLEEGAESLLTAIRRRRPWLIQGANALERRMLDALGARELGVSPIHSDRSAHGVMLCHNGKRGRPLEALELGALGAVCREMGAALDHARQYARMRQSAERDALTGLNNRGYMDKRLAQEFAYARKQNAPLALVMMDIDHFKKFNDDFGHQEGDHVLKMVAGTLGALTRTDGVAGRFGGEEFMVILRGAQMADAMQYAERIRSGVASMGRALGKRRYQGRPLTISVGVSACQGELPDAEHLVKQADQALYLAKSRGRNRVAGDDKERTAA
ncbi:sensor domain-containing diguanylate cyclase [Magnetofaba australis]|nr:diguanylate cyclase [Magnetofaba australis]